MCVSADHALLPVLGICGLLVLLTFVLAQVIVRPVEKLSAAARALASGQQVGPLRPTLEVREIRSLFDDCDAMTAGIARRSRYLRDFTASLGDEFKTPLAGLRSGIELLQDHGRDMSGEQRARFLANRAADADRLPLLISRLMKLAENARQAGATRFAIAAHEQDGWCTVSLTDNGSGIPAGDREPVFGPFFTSRREAGGTGPGLPIARFGAEPARVVGAGRKQRQRRCSSCFICRSQAPSKRIAAGQDASNQPRALFGRKQRASGPRFRTSGNGWAPAGGRLRHAPVRE